MEYISSSQHVPDVRLMCPKALPGLIVRFSRAIVREPAPNFSEGITEAGLGLPDFDVALEQHKNYCKALERCGLELISLPACSAFPDSCFVEDTVIVVDGTAVVARPGHVSRRGEETEVAAILGKYKTLTHVQEPGTIDGGDVMRVGDRFFVGITKRTNSSGAQQLGKAIESYGKTYTAIEVEDFLHLKTFVTAIDDKTIVCLESHRSVFRGEHLNVIAVPESELGAANCLVANDFVLMPPDCPSTRSKIEALGYKVIEVDTCEFQKMDGRLTCLSILF